MVERRPKVASPLVCVLLLCVFGAAAAFPGCDSDESEGCTSPEVLPHISPVMLGDFYPQGGTDADPGDNERAPFEFVLLLRSQCSAPVKVDKACIVGDDRGAFTLEGPTPESIPSNEEGAIRITYDHPDPTPNGAMEHVAVIVESNATNFPSLIVPFCARIIANGEDKRNYGDPANAYEIVCPDVPAEPGTTCP